MGVLPEVERGLGKLRIYMQLIKPSLSLAPTWEACPPLTPGEMNGTVWGSLLISNIPYLSTIPKLRFQGLKKKQEYEFWTKIQYDLNLFAQGLRLKPHASVPLIPLQNDDMPHAMLEMIHRDLSTQQCLSSCCWIGAGAPALCRPKEKLNSKFLPCTSIGCFLQLRPGGVCYLLYCWLQR